MNKQNKMLAIPGAFVPANDTVTLISYKHLRLQDYQVKVIALKAPEDETIMNELLKDDNYQKFDVEYTYDYDKTVATFEKKNVIEGVINIFRYVRKAIQESKKSDYQVVYTSSIPAFTHLAGYFIKRRMKKNIKWIASLSDPLYKSPYKYDKDSFKEYSLLAKIGFHVYIAIYMNGLYEKIAMKHADEIIFISEEHRDFTVSNYSKAKQAEYNGRTRIIPLNYIPEWDIYKEMVEYRDPESHQKPYSIVHFGRVYGHRRIEKLLIALKEMKEENPQLAQELYFEQYGELIPRYQKMIQEYDISDVFKYYEKIPYGEVTEKMKDCDILALFDTILDVDNQPYLPSKTLEYILLRKEIFVLSPENCPAHRILSSLGYNCVNYEVEAIKNQLYQFIKNGPKHYNYSLESFKNKDYYF